VLPSIRGNRVQLLFAAQRLGDSAWHPTDAVSIRAADSDCSLPPALLNESTAQAALILLGRDDLLQEDLLTARLASLPPGLYQLCFHARSRTAVAPPPGYAVPSPSATGISLRLQRAATQLTVNSIMPAGGLRAVVPRTSGNHISIALRAPQTPMTSGQGLAGVSLAAPFLAARDSSNATGTHSIRVWLVSPATHCNDTLSVVAPAEEASIQATYQPPLADNSSGAGTVVVELSGSELDAALATLRQGVYQVCISHEHNSSAMGTGLSLRLQSQLTAVEVNGLWMGPRRTATSTVVAAAPRRSGCTLRALEVRAGSEAPWSSQSELWPAYSAETPALSLVGAESDCHALADNPREVDAGRNASGLLLWASAGALSVINGTDLFEKLTPGVYQVCARPAKSSVPAGLGVFDGDGFSSMLATGLSLELQDVILGVWVGDRLAVDGLRAVMSGAAGEQGFLRGRMDLNGFAAQPPALRADLVGILLIPSYPGAPPCNSFNRSEGAQGTALFAAAGAAGAEDWQTSARVPPDLAHTACCASSHPTACGVSTVCRAAANGSNASTANCSTTPRARPSYCPAADGEHEICFRLAGGHYRSTGVLVLLKPPPSSPIAAMWVNGALQVPQESPVKRKRTLRKSPAGGKEAH